MSGEIGGTRRLEGLDRSHPHDQDQDRRLAHGGHDPRLGTMPARGLGYKGVKDGTRILHRNGNELQDRGHHVEHQDAQSYLLA